MKYLLKLILDSIKQGCLYVMSRPLFLVSIVAIPLVSAFLMLNLMSDGLANDVPVAIVDLDGSEMSRSIAANIDAMQTTKVVMTCSDFGEARAAVQEGKIMGFFLIPEDFSDEAHFVFGFNGDKSFTSVLPFSSLLIAPTGQESSHGTGTLIMALYGQLLKHIPQLMHSSELI